MAQRGKGDRRRPSPDDGLAVENFPELNSNFYRMSPHGYLRMRLRSLYLWMGNPAGMYGLLGEGVKFEEMAISHSGEPDEEDEEERRRFTAIESEVLLHHVGETLLRLYLVHARLPGGVHKSDRDWGLGARVGLVDARSPDPASSPQIRR